MQSYKYNYQERRKVKGKLFSHSSQKVREEKICQTQRSKKQEYNQSKTRYNTI